MKIKSQHIKIGEAERQKELFMIMLLSHEANLEISCFCFSYYINRKEIYDLRYCFLDFLVFESKPTLMNKNSFVTYFSILNQESR